MKFWRKVACKVTSFVVWLSVKLVLKKVDAFQGRVCLNFHLSLLLGWWGFEMSIVPLNSWLCLFHIQKCWLSTVNFFCGPISEYLTWQHLLTRPVVQHRLKHLRNMSNFRTSRNSCTRAVCVCCLIYWAKRSGATAMMMMMMTSLGGYAKINTSESSYSIPQPPSRFQGFTAASWSLQTRLKSIFHLLSSSKADFFPPVHLLSTDGVTD